MSIIKKFTWMTLYINKKKKKKKSRNDGQFWTESVISQIIRISHKSSSLMVYKLFKPFPLVRKNSSSSVVSKFAYSWNPIFQVWHFGSGLSVKVDSKKRGKKKSEKFGSFAFFFSL